MAPSLEPASRKGGLPIGSFEGQDDLDQWLADHPDAKGIWIRFPKKGSSWKAINKEQALDVALCHGWIDGQSSAGDAESFLMRFTPRRPRSNWSRLNCLRAETLITERRFHDSGMAQVNAAKADGRWDNAYAPPSTMVAPQQLQEAFSRLPDVAEAFKRLSRSRQYALLLNIVTKKRPETRQRKIDELLNELHLSLHGTPPP